MAFMQEFSYVDSPLDVPINVTVHLRIIDGVATCHHVEVERHDGQPLTAVDIRRVPFGQLISTGSQGFLTSSPRAAPDPESFLEEVASVYRKALREGEPPTAAVAQAFGLSERTASRRVADARKAGHLGAALNRRGGEAIHPSGPPVREYAPTFIAHRFHEHYQRLAPMDHETRKESAVPWEGGRACGQPPPDGARRNPPDPRGHRDCRAEVARAHGRYVGGKSARSTAARDRVRRAA